MKIKKFERLVAQHPWLFGWIATWTHLYGLKYERNEAQMNKLRDIIRDEFLYIAFRPFKSVDLMWTSKIVSREEIPGSFHQIETRLMYEVLWHADDEPRCNRRQTLMLGSEHPRLATIGEICNSVVEFHADHPSSIKKIHFDAIMRKGSTLSTADGDYTKVSIEIFLCSPDWVPKWMRTDTDLHRRLAARQIRIPGMEKRVTDPAGEIVLQKDDDYPLN